MSTEQPTAAPVPQPPEETPEEMMSRLSGLRQNIVELRAQGVDIGADVIQQSTDMFKKSRDAVMDMSSDALGKFKAEINLWRDTLPDLPPSLKTEIQETTVTVETLYEKFKENTIAFAQSPLEKTVGALSRMGEMLSSGVDSFQKFTAKLLAPLLPLLLSFGIPVPEWLQPQGPGMKELFAALSANKRKLEQTPDDDKNMREIIKIFSSIGNAAKTSQALTLASFILKAVEQTATEKEKITTKEIRESAVVVQTQVEEIARQPAVPVPPQIAPVAAPSVAAAPAGAPPPASPPAA